MEHIQINLEHISKTYDGRTILNPFDFTIQKGSSIAFVGHNGCGKSTLLKIIAGVIQPTTGSIHYPNGKPLFHYLPEKFYPVPLKSRVYLESMGEIDGISQKEVKEKIETLAEAFFVTEFLDVPMKALSKGTLQKMGVIQALLSEPDVLLLDEPLSGQDEDSKNVFIQKINKLREKGITILMSCHEKELMDALTEKRYTIQNGVFQEYQEKTRKRYGLLLEKKNVEKVPDGMEKYGSGFRLFVTEEEADQKIMSLLQAGWSLKGMYHEGNVE